MPTIRELFDECTHNNYSYTAHALYFLLSEGLVSADDPHTILDHVEVDEERVSEWTKQNYLCIHMEKVYSLKISDAEFVFVYAKNTVEAVAFIQKKWTINLRNCHEYPLDFTIMRGKECISFREMKKDFQSIPAIIGTYQKEEVYHEKSKKDQLTAS